VRNSDGSAAALLGVTRDITERKRAEEQQRVLNAELDHRVKNMLATVSAIIMQTPKVDGSLAEYVAGLDQRIKALARTHELLSESHWNGASLEEIARRELAPYLADNAELRGPRVLLKAESAQALALVLHELTTNAAKYGAFSQHGGRLSVQWQWQRNGSGRHLIIDWQELGGPSVREPVQCGYGTSIIRELIPFELRGTAVLNFATSGLQCRLEIPADWVSGTDRVDVGARQFGLNQSSLN
jgi:two-component sensor histidine kinase